MDEGAVKVMADGDPRLTSGNSYTLYSCTNTSKHEDTFECIAYYTADQTGIIDVAKQPSFGGYYKGIEPMALVMELKSSSKSKRLARPVRNDNMKPLEISLRVYRGVLSLPTTSKLGSEDEVVTESAIHRLAVVAVPGKSKIRSRKNSIINVEFSAVGMTRSISDVTNSSSSSKSNLQLTRSRGLSTEF